MLTPPKLPTSVHIAIESYPATLYLSHSPLIQVTLVCLQICVRFECIPLSLGNSHECDGPQFSAVVL